MAKTIGTIITWDSVTFKSLAALHALYPDVEANGLQANPNWVSPASGDFHLTENSPAIDSAIPPRRASCARSRRHTPQ